MEFLCGKYYLTSLNQKAILYALYQKANIIHGAILSGKDGHVLEYPYQTRWNLAGRNLDCAGNLASEWTEGHPAQYWPAQTIVEVSMSEKVWFLRRFAMYQPEANHPFLTYGESTGCNTTVLVGWKHARLPDNPSPTK